METKKKMAIRWTGINETDCIENYKKWFKDADPNAKYYQNGDGLWVIEADAVKVNIPAVQITNPDGKKVIVSMEDYAKMKAEAPTAEALK